MTPAQNPWLHDFRVHCFRMKNVTLSADEDLIERARAIARAQRRTLNSAFREWLAEFTSREGGAREYRALMKSLRHVDAGRHFTRDEMNER
jgi:predicted transcriptional regulator